MCDTHRKHARTAVPCPTAQQGLIHPHMPNAPPQHALSWRQPWQQLALALLRGPVHGTRLLSAKGPPPPRDAEGQTGCAQHSGVLTAGTTAADRQTNPPNLGVSKAVTPPEPSPPPPRLGNVPHPCTLPGWGTVAAAQGGPATLPVPVQAAGVCRCACTLAGSTLGLWGCCCSFAPWLPGNGEHNRQSSGSSGAEC